MRWLLLGQSLVLDERLACTWDPYNIRACQNLGWSRKKKKKKKKNKRKKKKRRRRRNHRQNEKKSKQASAYPAPLIQSELHQRNMQNEGLRAHMGSLARLGRWSQLFCLFLQLLLHILGVLAITALIRTNNPDRYGCTSFGRNDALIRVGNRWKQLKVFS